MNGRDSGDVWYVKRGPLVEGPLPAAQIARRIGLGRLHPNDELSVDGDTWQALAGFDAGAFGALRGAAAHDERSGERRSDAATAAATEQRGAHDRRIAESPVVQARRLRSARVWATLTPARPRRARALLALALLLVTLLALAIELAQPPRPLAIDCSGAPASHTRWDFCDFAARRFDGAELARISARNASFAGASLYAAHLRAADLAYADLDGADLALADLRATRLVGASLRRAKLNHANLTHADLRYADLTAASLGGAELRRARFDHALWIDGRVCARGSVGACR